MSTGNTKMVIAEEILTVNTAFNANRKWLQCKLPTRKTKLSTYNSIMTPTMMYVTKKDKRVLEQDGKGRRNVEEDL